MTLQHAERGDSGPLRTGHEDTRGQRGGSGMSTVMERPAPSELSPEHAPAGPRGALNRRSILRGTGLLLLVAFVLTMPYDMNWAGSAFALDYGVIIGMLVLAVSVLGWIGEI